jgi:hypothetical protein
VFILAYVCGGSARLRWSRAFVYVALLARFLISAIDLSASALYASLPDNTAGRERKQSALIITLLHVYSCALKYSSHSEVLGS